MTWPRWWNCHYWRSSSSSAVTPSIVSPTATPNKPPSSSGEPEPVSFDTRTQSGSCDIIHTVTAHEWLTVKAAAKAATIAIVTAAMASSSASATAASSPASSGNGSNSNGGSDTKLSMSMEMAIDEANLSRSIRVSRSPGQRRLQIALVGAPGSGKSSMIWRLQQPDMKWNSEAQSATIGIDSFMFKWWDKIRGHFVYFQSWDTAGQERYQAITTAYMRKSQGFLVVIDVLDEYGLEKAAKWVDHINSVCTSSLLPIVLVANKCDASASSTPLSSEPSTAPDNGIIERTADAPRMITREQIASFAERLQVPYIECSARTNDGIQASFHRLASLMVAQYPAYTPTASPSSTDSKNKPSLPSSKLANKAPAIGNSLATAAATAVAKQEKDRAAERQSCASKMRQCERQCNSCFT